MRPREVYTVKLEKAFKMTSPPLKRPGRLSKGKCRKQRLSISSLIFCLVVLFSIVYTVYQFVPSHKNASPNISQSTESAVSAAVNDKIRSNEGANANDKISSKAKGKKQINNTAKFNGSFVNESEVNFFENQRTEKPKSILAKADKKKTTKKIKVLIFFWTNDQKRHFNDLLMNGIFKAKLSNGFRKMNRRMSSKKNSKKKIIDQFVFEKKENKQDENSAIDTILCFSCGLTFFVILALNFLYFLLPGVKTNNSKYLLQNTLYRSRSSKTLLMALGLLLSYAPVSSDVALSTQGTYFQNHAPGRYLKGYVEESSVVPSLMHCQMRCDTLHLTCASLNYIEKDDGLNICEINFDAQYCALPGDFIVKKNSFYVETMPGKDDVVLCSTCEHKGVIKKTNEIPGFMCLCQAGFYGDRCQHVIIDDLNSSPTLNGKPDYIRQLRLWLPGSNKWRLCWRASQHGWASTTFHSQCDNKGPTVTIVRVGEYIFGGYADVSWTSTGNYVSSVNAFMFSLKNKDNLKPFKAAVYRNSHRALYCHSNYGPTFGDNHDIYIPNNANSTTASWAKLGRTYQPPPGYTLDAANTKALLAGTYYFTPSEIEVFYLQ